MTALEEQVRAALASRANTLMNAYPLRGVRDDGAIPAWVREPDRVDATVFGPQQPERAACTDYPAILRTCREHDVQWRDGKTCWCCKAGIAPLKNYY